MSRNIQQLLRQAACSQPNRGLIVRNPSNPDLEATVTYAALLDTARKYSNLLGMARAFRKRSPVLIYFDNHLHSVVWFWAALLADAIPVMVPQLSNIEEHRHSLVQSLDDLLEGPPWIMASRNLDQLTPDQATHLNISTLEELMSWSDPPSSRREESQSHANGDDDAIFLLTSGSTGNPKAVRITHNQILSSVHGKLSARGLPIAKPFLNWIGFDHVASIVEIHLTAMCFMVDQIHVQPAAMTSDPLHFLRLLSDHQVSRTFAPNFFLARLVPLIQDPSLEPVLSQLRFDHLNWLGSGGEANDIKIIVDVSAFLSNHGSRSDVLVPGFGMTETCAGAIYNLQCPSIDVGKDQAYCSLGQCITGVEMRINMSDGGREGRMERNQVATGNLELRGPVIFKGYFKDPRATKAAFTADGWFRTGDQARIDQEGNLHLIGRVKETMIINGVNYFAQEIESLIQNAVSSQAKRIICFPYRPSSAPTEAVCVLFVPAQKDDHFAVWDIHNKIVQVVMLRTASRPYVISLPDESSLNTSSLGKVSRSRCQQLLSEGYFTEAAQRHESLIQSQQPTEPLNSEERALLEDIASILDMDVHRLELSRTIFEAGMTSVDVLRLKGRLEEKSHAFIPISLLILNPTIRSLCKALKGLESSSGYDPVVPLRRGGSKTPLWLIHPGVGEVLVFLQLSEHIKDRPLYALRARGFDGHQCFNSVEEIVTTYLDAIKRIQPQGPFAIAGYSFGAMLAFEVCKRLEENGHGFDQVSFFGSFNLPPHIKYRMRLLDWNQCLLHLCHFLDLISPSILDAVSPDLYGKSREEALRHLLDDHISRQQLLKLSLDTPSLIRWTDIAYSLQSSAVDYDPAGSVSKIDVFHADPLRSVSKSRNDWTENHLSRWKDFCDTEPRFHAVDGAHYTMLNSKHVAKFSQILRDAMESRGV